MRHQLKGMDVVFKVSKEAAGPASSSKQQQAERLIECLLLRQVNPNSGLLTETHLGAACLVALVSAVTGYPPNPMVR